MPHKLISDQPVCITAMACLLETLCQTVFQAMAETVGSIMANHCGKGRFLTPSNFSMELYLGDIPIFNKYYLYCTRV